MRRECYTHKNFAKLYLEIVVEGGVGRETQEMILKQILEEPLSSSIIINHKRAIKLPLCYWFSSTASSFK
jgi:hypothetical protein